jgi:hypothetical protein
MEKTTKGLLGEANSQPLSQSLQLPDLLRVLFGSTMALQLFAGFETRRTFWRHLT